MPAKHRSIVYLKAMMPLLGEDEPDWGTIEELFVHASVHINNSLAAFRDSLKQHDLPLHVTAKDTAPVITKEPIYSCTHCQTTWSQSLGESHTCDEGQWYQASLRRCALCGGYVRPGEEAATGVEGEVLHRVACVEPDTITDEARMLPELTTRCRSCDKQVLDALIVVTKDDNLLCSECAKVSTPEPYTQEQGNKLIQAGAVEGIKVYPWVCLFCGDGFVSRAIWESHVKSQSHGTSVPTQITVGGTPFWVQSGETTGAAILAAFRVAELWAPSDDGRELVHVADRFHLGDADMEDVFYFEDSTTTATTTTPETPAEKATSDNGKKKKRGVVLKLKPCSFCEQDFIADNLRLIGDSKGFTCKECWEEHQSKVGALISLTIRLSATAKPFVKFGQKFEQTPTTYQVTQFEAAALAKDGRVMVVEDSRLFPGEKINLKKENKAGQWARLSVKPSVNPFRWRTYKLNYEPQDHYLTEKELTAARGDDRLVVELQEAAQ